MEAEISDEQLSQFGDFVARTMGLHFPSTRWPELRRGIVAAAKSLDCPDASDCARSLMSAPLSKHRLEVLASHLTVGETYFFRDNKAFEILASHILPPLIRDCREREKRLRIWSAACCTGEEPYSIAILLCRTIPDWQEWNLTLLATDINSHFLRRAEAGIFSQWSFRDAPEWLKPQYFQATADGQFEISPQIRRMVRFAQLNLVDDVFPSLANDTNAIDIIFCRNVLMYFTPPQANKVLHNLYRAQVDGGYLIVGASELMHMSSTPYVTTSFPGATLFQKNTAKSQQGFQDRNWAVSTVTAAVNPPSLETVIQPAFPAPSASHEQLFSAIPVQAVEIPAYPSAYAEAAVLYEQGQYVEAVAKLRAAGTSHSLAGLGLLTRALANLGKLGEALVYCNQWVAADKLNPSAHYLCAVVLQEEGKFEEAVRSLRTALYLDPNYPLAHFAMANLARQGGRTGDADKHLRHARQVLRGYQPDKTLPESDGIMAGRLAEIIDTLINTEVPV